MIRLSLVFVASIILSACTWAVGSKDELKQTGFAKSERFAVNYQALYRCFTNQVQIGSNVPLSEGPVAELYPDLKTGEYRLGRGRAWFMLVEFVGVEPNLTQVNAYDLREGWLDDHWRLVAACVGKTS